MFGKREKKVKVLFVEEKNDLVSQLTEYFTNEYFGNKYEAYSAGPKKDMIDCELISVMYQKGKDMRRQVSKDFRDRDYLRDEEDYDLVIYLSKDTFDEWAKRTPWQGKQMLAEIEGKENFRATDDLELWNCYAELIDRVGAWVKENMADPDKLRSMISA